MIPDNVKMVEMTKEDFFRSLGFEPSPEEKSSWAKMLKDDEGDFLSGKTCNPKAPEECESCQ